MRPAKQGETSHREDSYEPASMLRAPGADVGVLLLRHRSSVSNHLHHDCDANFRYIFINAPPSPGDTILIHRTTATSPHPPQ